ncbi:MAG: hypothetical protein LC541_14960 [Candidatus Thiodiazotropha sp.]|nr:hypothetical protein [Candidatus Thiodiazotropha sp.]MCM8884570.1 hypothetical protein [Candidatus Thiodiazotropha sp.]MCM8921390.1 hypothetical protein [Candidatus Thiodiazotropha sp.]
MEAPNVFYWNLPKAQRTQLAREVGLQEPYMERFTLPKNQPIPRRVIRPQKMKSLYAELKRQGWNGDYYNLLIYFYPKDALVEGQH